MEKKSKRSIIQQGIRRGFFSFFNVITEIIIRFFFIYVYLLSIDFLCLSSSFVIYIVNALIRSKDVITR